MASSSRNSDNRPIHQDFIARIRYSNALPPPPNPPKLLDIPNTGLASGQYTEPGFASRLAREQPLNIEADAELGMPLDLVGMPGIFDGDESSIQAPAQAPQPHPHDKPLLRSIQQLGKPKTDNAAVSFLRRTEYISSAGSKATGSNPLRALNTTPAARRIAKRKASPEPDKDSPAYVKRKIDQSFSITEQNLRDKTRIRHPTKRNLKLVETYPLLPDLEAFPDSGTYVTIKFLTNPVGKSTKYDSRLLNGVFRPIAKTDVEEAAIQAAREAYELDPQNNPRPADTMHYDYYLNDTESNGKKFRQRFDLDNPNHDDESLYPHKHDSEGCFQFSRLRAYETAHETELDHRSKYDEELIIAFNDDESSLHQKAVYYYPVMQRSQIRPQRTKNIARKIGIADEEEQIIDQLDITVDDPSDEIKEQAERFKRDPYGLEGEGEGEEEEAADEEVHQNGNVHEDTNGRSRSRTPPAHSDEELDAEGDEED
ncbi:RNA polymerase II-associated [Truncatella angustata]|uniref:RNA polymerase II-associated n=1 Tax=Truncatella angustata TaxID=152316 RepID=A0A9P8UZR3_9PEZI|nr:RNA polymerase II-associated [Truncatella angustata]KAH6661095.1 RNA polymerase II-associated [Truncatella angustata]